MSKLEVSILNNNIVFSENLVFFKKLRNRNVLKKFNPISSENLIEIDVNNLKSPEEFYNLKESLDHNIGQENIKYNSDFLQIIEDRNQTEINFKIFSKKAVEIWNNKYDSIEFRNFTNVLKKKLARRLYPLQLKSAYHIAFSQNSCNFSVPGAGKTTIVYGAYSYLNNLDTNDKKFVNKIIIVGPPSSYTPWKKEYYKCFKKEANIFRFSGETPLIKKKEVLNGLSSENYDILHFTYQSINSLHNSIQKYINAPDNSVMMVCDEAHYFKGFQKVWSSNILSLAPDIKSRIILTGTPVSNGYEDLYNLFKFIYPKRNVLRFNYGALQSLSKGLFKQSSVDKIIEDIKPFFIRIKKSDLNLPPYNDNENISYLNNFEKRVYDRLAMALDNRDVEGNRTSLFFRLIQSSNNLNLLNKAIEIDNNLFNNVEDNVNLNSILGEELSNEISNINDNYIPSKHIKVGHLVKSLSIKKQKVIIWGIFVDSIKRLHRYLKNIGLKGYYVIGETKKKRSKKNNDTNLELNREEIIEEFQDKKSDLDYIITNPIVLGESISLHKVCHHSIYFELSYRAAPYVQSRDRIHRVWLDKKTNIQKNYPTNYYHFISKNTVDERIFISVKRKILRMLEIIEQDIPFFNENDFNDERSKIIKQIINEYSS
jgi:hypothetical protein